MEEKVLKVLQYTLAFMFGILVATIIYNLPQVRFDVNRDGKVTLADAVQVVNYYLEDRNN